MTKRFKNIANLTKTLMPTERQEAHALAKYLRIKGILFMKIPSEGKRSPIFGANLKQEGWSRGYPDYIITEKRHGFSGLAIELKVIDKKRAKVSPEQNWWQKVLTDRGWFAVVCYGFDDAKKILDYYFMDSWPANNVWQTLPNDFFNDALPEKFG